MTVVISPFVIIEIANHHRLNKLVKDKLLGWFWYEMRNYLVHEPIDMHNQARDYNVLSSQKRD